MNLREQQRDRLRRTIDWARKIEQTLAPAREQHLGELHFRPGPAGVAMVGLRPERPQRGKSGMRNLDRVADRCEALYAEHCVDCAHGRLTPEKRLQSFLVSQAYREGRALTSLLPHPEPALHFVTDELSLPTEDGRIVCDLLALHGRSPAVIELKPARAMKRLVEQVTRYAALVDEHLDLFAELYAVILGRDSPLDAPCERWIVWPAAPGHTTDPREDQLAALAIRVVGYTEVEGGFEFVVGRTPDA